MEKDEGKRHSERRGSRWEDNVKMDLKEIRQENVDWFCLAHDWEFGGLFRMQ